MEGLDSLGVRQPQAPSTPSNVNAVHLAIKIGATLAIWLLLLSIYGRWLIYALPDRLGETLGRLPSPLGMLTDFMNPVFPSPAHFFILGALCRHWPSRPWFGEPPRSLPKLVLG